MAYKYIKIEAIPAPLGEVLDANSPQQQGVRAEMALVMAAPDLLVALEEVTKCLEWHDQYHSVGKDRALLDTALAAIAKAKGE